MSSGFLYEWCRGSWDIIFDEIHNNRPVILNYCEPCGGHSAVAYHCIIEQDPHSGRYQNINLKIRTGMSGNPPHYIPPTKTVSAVSYNLNSVITLNIRKMLYKFIFNNCDISNKESYFVVA